MTLVTIPKSQDTNWPRDGSKVSIRDQAMVNASATTSSAVSAPRRRAAKR